MQIVLRPAAARGEPLQCHIVEHTMQLGVPSSWPAINTQNTHKHVDLQQRGRVAAIIEHNMAGAAHPQHRQQAHTTPARSSMACCHQRWSAAKPGNRREAIGESLRYRNSHNTPILSISWPKNNRQNTNPCRIAPPTHITVVALPRVTCLKVLPTPPAVVLEQLFCMLSFSIESNPVPNGVYTVCNISGSTQVPVRLLRLSIAPRALTCELLPCMLSSSISSKSLRPVSSRHKPQNVPPPTLLPDTRQYCPSPGPSTRMMDTPLPMLTSRYGNSSLSAARQQPAARKTHRVKEA